MEKNTWKTLAIVFILLFTLLLSYCIWAVSVYNNSIEDSNECLYEVCADNYDAYLDEYGICTCYDLDEYGDYEIIKTINLNS